jgi:tetratricopeptide (TPR) repeat protein
MQTQPAQAAHTDSRQINRIKWALGCSGVGMLLFTGVAMVVLMVTPVVFRNLLPSEQVSLINRFPFMAAFQPTRPFQYHLPTVAANNTNAIELLTPLADVTLTPHSFTNNQGDGQDSMSGGILSSSTPKAVAKLPTSILATNTPVVGAPPISPTPQPSPTQGPTMVPTSVPTATLIPIPPNFHANGFTWVKQGWNNCGPANLTQALQYYGWKGAQADAAGWLKPNKEDKNVSPWQMVAYVREHTGVKAIMRVAGDPILLKRLISQRFAVIIEKGYIIPNEGTWAGHYLTMLGYDDNRTMFYALDTNLETDAGGLGTSESYADFDEHWQQFNRTYIVVYTEDREGELASILGPDADLSYNWQHALSLAKTEASSQPGNWAPWFNMGTSLVMLQDYRNAAKAFDQAFSMTNLPYRILWYQFSPYEAYYNIGDFDRVISTATTSARTSIWIEETFYWRAMGYAASGEDAKAISDFEDALRINPNFTFAADKMAQVKVGNFTPPDLAQAGS